MTVKQMVTETYGDMKIVRPIVESLNGQNLDTRLRAVEQHISDDAIANGIRRKMISQVGGISNKVLFIALGIGEIIIAILGFVNHNAIVVHP